MKWQVTARTAGNERAFAQMLGLIEKPHREETTQVAFGGTSSLVMRMRANAAQWRAI
jgi:hypothetical protein